MSGAETILLAEDEDGIRSIARRVLQMYGYQVLEARDGAEALAVSAQHKGPIHLLLADIIMPQIDGPELASRLAQTRTGIKVLYTSGYADDARTGVLTGSVAFLQKPYAPQTLVAKVREVLGNGVMALQTNRNPPLLPEQAARHFADPV
jgi:two-component system, cell cycle sensor histidine kinase and response regulator CckA